MRNAADDLRDALRRWLRENIEERGLSATRVGKDTGIATSTLTKFLNDPNYKFTPTTTNIAKLEHYFGRPAPRIAPAVGVALPEIEGRPVDPDGLPKRLAGALSALRGDRRHTELWEINSRALETRGCLPGDIVVIDPEEPPMAGDMVRAEVNENGRIRSIFRLYQPPFLQAAAFDPTLFPTLLVDGKNVMVKGVVTDRVARRPTVN